VDRRFQQRGQARGVTVVDDYGHHPTEIRATLLRRGSARTAESTWSSSRTGTPELSIFWRSLAVHSLDADTVIVLPIYAASEEPIPGVTAERLAERIHGPRVEFTPELPRPSLRCGRRARRRLNPDAGAGSVSQLAAQILAALEDSPGALLDKNC